MSKERVLALLNAAAGEYCSGEEMSKVLGISRAAVWKAVEVLRNEGCVISSLPRKGYRLDELPDGVRPEVLAQALSGCRLGREIVCLDTTDSTNSEVKRRAAAGAKEGLVVTAEEQAGGRGRRGRNFQSLRGQGLYLSALLRPALPPATAVELTAYTAVAVCDGIEVCCGVRPQIKWTNDIVLGGKKLCGILTEMEIEGESGALNFVVVGIGVNVKQTPSDFGPELSSIAISLESYLGRTVYRGALVEHILRSLDEMYKDFPEKKELWLARYRSDCVTVGREVVILRDNKEKSAYAEGIDHNFNLMVRFPDGRHENITAGEVSVRGLLGYI